MINLNCIKNIYLCVKVCFFFFCFVLIIIYTFVFANLKRVLSEQIEKRK